MKSVGGGTPKALLPVGDYTFIDWQLQWLKLLGVGNVILSLAHEGKIIEDHIEKQKKILDFSKLEYSYDGPELLGTGGAIKNAAKLLEKDFLIIYGDSFLFIDLKDFKETHEKGGHPLTLSIFKNHDQGDKSNVIYKDGTLLKYDKVKKTKDMEYIDYGLSFVNRDYFLKNTPKGVFDFASFIHETVSRKKATPYVAKVMFHEIGSLEGYSRFLEMIEENNFDLKKLRPLVQ